MRRTILIAALLATVAGIGPKPALGKSFQDIIGKSTILAPVGQAFADSVGAALPVTAASGGVTFTFDKETHAFERETDIFGQLYLERPRPLGRGRWNFSLNYEWIKVDELNGQDLSEWHDTGPPIRDPANGALFTLPRFHVSLVNHQVTASTTYGITDDVDINLALPVLYSEFQFDGAVHVVGGVGQPPEHERSTKLGVGDLRLRGKYRFARGTWGELAGGLVLRFPTGDEDNFQGTGTFQVGPFLYGATAPYLVRSDVRLQGYINLGIDFAAQDTGQRSEGRWGLGLDCAWAERLTLAIAFVGREPFGGIAEPGSFDVVRVNQRTGQQFMSPVLGLSTARPNIADFSFGGRVKLWRDTVFGYANVLVPLNEQGFRTAPIPVAGIEATF